MSDISSKHLYKKCPKILYHVPNIKTLDYRFLLNNIVSPWYKKRIAMSGERSRWTSRQPSLRERDYHNCSIAFGACCVRWAITRTRTGAAARRDRVRALVHQVGYRTVQVLWDERLSGGTVVSTRKTEPHAHATHSWVSGCKRELRGLFLWVRYCFISETDNRIPISTY